MKHLISLLATASLINLSACATIIEGSSDQIAIKTAPSMSATCSLVNKRGTYNVTTPSTTTVQKSRSDLKVSCVNPRTGARGNSIIASDVEPWTFGNILIGGLVGLGIDWSTGSAYDYPASTTVPIGMPKARPATHNRKPAAHKSHRTAKKKSHARPKSRQKKGKSHR